MASSSGLGGAGVSIGGAGSGCAGAGGGGSATATPFSASPDLVTLTFKGEEGTDCVMKMRFQRSATVGDVKRALAVGVARPSFPIAKACS